MVAWLTTHIVELAVGAIALGLISFVIGICALVSAGKTNRKTRRRNRNDGLDVTSLTESLRQELDNLSVQLSAVHNDIASIRDTMRHKVGTPQVLRYNAFNDTGSDLSFSVALLDDHQTGVVLSSIYGREESRSYAKPVQAGESTYPLTDEERQAISGEETPRSTRKRRFAQSQV